MHPGAQGPAPLASRAKPSEALLPHGLFLVFAFVWGTNYILAEVALCEFSSISFGVSRFLVGGALSWSSSTGSTACACGGARAPFPSFRNSKKSLAPAYARFCPRGYVGAVAGIEDLELTHGALWGAMGPSLSLQRARPSADCYLLVVAPSLTVNPWTQLSAWTGIAVLVGGVVGVGIAQWVKYRALKVIGTTRVIICGYLAPLATVRMAWATIGIVPSVLKLIAVFFSVVGRVLPGLLCSGPNF